MDVPADPEKTTGPALLLDWRARVARATRYMTKEART